MAKMRIYYSGVGGYRADPEYIVRRWLRRGTQIMLSYFKFRTKSYGQRWDWIKKSRKKEESE